MNSSDLIDFICSKPGPRLVIFNTVQSAAVLAYKMRKQNKQVMHLSTALTPNDREKIVDKINIQLNDETKIDWTLVATSCVEAGMDFSFATAFRESCSAASLIQIGGRVNRHGDKGIAEVWDFRVNDSMMRDNPQLATSQNVLRKLFKENYFENKSATEIVTKAMEMELMSDFGDFERKSKEIKKQENQNDFPEVTKLCRIIDSDTRLVIVTKGIAEAVERYEKINPIDLIRNSVQIRFFKVSSSHFKEFCAPLNAHEELYQWRGMYESDFLGYMAAIVPLIEMDAINYSIA